MNDFDRDEQPESGRMTRSRDHLWDAAMVSRQVRVGQRCVTVSLEQAFWDGLAFAAHSLGVTEFDLVEVAVRRSESGGATPARELRRIVVEYFRLGAGRAAGDAIERDARFQEDPGPDLPRMADNIVDFPGDRIRRRL
jgi:predicted DNA-binding ribbon-helix-helix protein